MKRCALAALELILQHPVPVDRLPVADRERLHAEILAELGVCEVLHHEPHWPRPRVCLTAFGRCGPEMAAAERHAVGIGKRVRQIGGSLIGTVLTTQLGEYFVHWDRDSTGGMPDISTWALRRCLVEVP